jgi:hypothetical protein
MAGTPVIIQQVHSDSKLGTQPEVRETLVTSARISPWEQARRERIVNAYYARHLNAADMDFVSLRNNFQRIASETVETDNMRRGIMLFLPPADGRGQLSVTLFQLITEDLLLKYFRFIGSQWETSRFLRLTQLRATRIIVGLVLYQKQHGKQAEKLEDLVPDILPSVPVDPYSNRLLQYRVSPGELIRWNASPTEEGGHDWWDEIASAPAEGPGAGAPGAAGMPGAAPGQGDDLRRMPGMPPEKPAPLPEKGRSKGGQRIVRAGTGIVWSTGPDTVDNGGTVQMFQPDYAGWYDARSGSDIIFLVPKIAPDLGKK